MRVLRLEISFPEDVSDFLAQLAKKRLTAYPEHKQVSMHRDEIKKIVNEIILEYAQHSPQANGALCPVCDFEQKIDQVCEEHGVYKITPRR